MRKKQFHKTFKKSANKIKKRAGISEKVIKLLDIYVMIAQNKFPSVSSLKEKFEVSERTIHRYLEIINCIDRIELDKDRHGYKFLQGDRIKKLTLTNNEFLLLLAMGETAVHMGQSFKKSYQELISDITDIRKMPSGKTRSPFMIKIPDAIETEKLSDYFEAISTCINEKRSIDIVYYALHSRETTERRVDPYGLIFYEGAWILTGYCHLREIIKHFALDRIQSLRETRLYFKPQEDFSIEKHVSRSWGIYDGDMVDVKVKFSANVAEYITRKEKWHPSEKRKILPNGDVELTFSVSGVKEIKRWIYSWLPNVEVIEPEWFREQVNKELSAVLEKQR